MGTVPLLGRALVFHLNGGVETQATRLYTFRHRSCSAHTQNRRSEA